TYTTQQTFITQFKAVSGASNSATDLNILLYFDKNLRPTQAAALYNGKDGIQVLGSELSKGSGAKVKYNGVEYEANKTDDIIAAKKISTSFFKFFRAIFTIPVSPI
ncbi:12458_t:CDS:1, partial [Funneliformis geosporum]